MSSLLPVLITWMQQYGYPVLWLTIFVAAMGIPLPVSFMLLAGGAFAVLGDFNVFLLGAIAVTASTCGDQVGYLLGRFIGRHVFAWLARPRRFNLVSPQTLQRSHLYFRKRGGLAVFLSRSVVSALGGTINLLAGAEDYPYHRFLLYDISGEICAAIIPLVLGYSFGASWEAIGDILGMISLFFVAILATVYLVYRLIRMQKRMKVTRVAQARRVEGKRASIPNIKERPDSLPL
jgi:membrane-associated protein